LPDSLKGPGRRGLAGSAPMGTGGIQMPTSNSGQNLDYDALKEQFEKEFIISALRANNGRINQTVAHANIPKNTLLRKIKKYGIQPKDYGGGGD
jgi:two-component system, NtrC family, response regulator AtoC